MTELGLHVLLAIGRGAAHGYAIGKDIEEQSGGRLDPTTGALYQSLKRLHEDGLIEERPAPPNERDTRRRYFALTRAGRAAVSAEVRRLEQIIALAQERRLYSVRP